MQNLIERKEIVDITSTLSYRLINLLHSYKDIHEVMVSGGVEILQLS